MAIYDWSVSIMNIVMVNDDHLGLEIDNLQRRIVIDISTNIASLYLVLVDIFDIKAYIGSWTSLF